MPMTVSQAFEIEDLFSKLTTLRFETTDAAERKTIDAQLAELAPRLSEAGAIVMKVTDAEFEAIADELKAKMKPLDAAIKDIKKMAAAIAQAAALINVLVAALGKVGFV